VAALIPMYVLDVKTLQILKRSCTLLFVFMTGGTTTDPVSAPYQFFYLKTYISG
jgi:hypothetical protein